MRRIVDGYGLSERKACRLMMQQRSTQRYETRRHDELEVRAMLRELAKD